MRNQEAKVERALVQAPLVSVGTRLRVQHRGGLPFRDPLTASSRRPVWVRRPHQVSAVVTKVCDVKLCKQSNTRPFLPIDLDQKALFLETTTSCSALGKKASHALLLFWNISMPLGCVPKYLWKSKEGNHPQSQTRNLNFEFCSYILSKKRHEARLSFRGN